MLKLSLYLFRKSAQNHSIEVTNSILPYVTLHNCNAKAVDAHNE
jgi:hypothetical protein